VDPARTFESVHRTITKTIKTLTQRGAAQQAELTVNDTLWCDMIPVFLAYCNPSSITTK